MAEYVFWGSALLVLYAYFGYPLLLAALSLVRGRPALRGDITPPLTFIITAFNEERQIERKILNSLEQDYPPGRLQIIVASDCSSDATDEIVRRYRDRGVELVRAPERRGKEAAQMLALEHARGEVVAFSDAATVLEPRALRMIVRSFADLEVGCVSSEDRVIDEQGRPGGEGAYVRYEMALRRLEGRVNSLVGLSGSFFAARREVCRGWQPDIQSDFNVLLSSVRLGLRGVSDPEALGYYHDVGDASREFARKRRTVLRGMSALWRNASMLNPFRHGLFALQLISHKLLRWLVPVFMLAALVSSAALLGRPAYRLLFGLQVGFYLLALGGAAGAGARAFRLPFFLLLTNTSILLAWLKFLRGERIVAWRPSER
jgi:cellulose synthase/poly-beta-1,6-N-acetylglucosamine synthase-like glycosyltransferase